MNTIKVKEKVDVYRDIEYVSCINCGSDDISFDDCGYSSFNVAYGRCKTCGNETIISPCAWNYSIDSIIKQWNENNDPIILKAKYEEEIEKHQKLINKLPKQ
jgi:hypothetical protein